MDLLSLFFVVFWLLAFLRELLDGGTPELGEWLCRTTA